MAKSVVDSDIELESLSHVVIHQITGGTQTNVVQVCSSAIESINKKLSLIHELREKSVLLDDHRLYKNRLR